MRVSDVKMEEYRRGKDDDTITGEFEI